VRSTCPLVFVPRPEDDPCVRQPDISMARAVLGWEPRVGLEEGLQRTISWFWTMYAQSAAAPEAQSA
jgi:dTDP-glucose 4,6-dehydratase